MKLTLACVLLVTACGDDGSVPLVLNAGGAKLAAIHDGERWTPVALDATGIASLALDGPTLVATVCDESGFFNYYAIGVGPGTEALDMYCGTAATPFRSVEVSAPPTTSVFAGSSSGRGDSTLLIEEGTHDVVAVDTSLTPPRVEIRRGVVITSNTTLAFDLAATGTPMTKVSVDVTGTGTGAAAHRSSRLVVGTPTAPTVAVWPATTDGDVWVVPETLRRPGDRHRVSATTSIDADNSRSVSQDVGHETTFSLALPAYVTTATVTLGAAPSLAWVGDDRVDDVYFGINTENFGRLWDVWLRPTWAEAGGEVQTVTLPDPTSLPEWKPEWSLPTSAMAVSWTMYASHDATPDYFFAMRSGWL